MEPTVVLLCLSFWAFIAITFSFKLIKILVLLFAIPNKYMGRNNVHLILFFPTTFQPGEKCSLQIHNRFSQSRNVQFPMGPLSEPNAVGLVIAHAHPGSALTGRVDVWITDDGGYTWAKVSQTHFTVVYIALCFHLILYACLST